MARVLLEVRRIPSRLGGRFRTGVVARLTVFDMAVVSAGSLDIFKLVFTFFHFEPD